MLWLLVMLCYVMLWLLVMVYDMLCYVIGIVCYGTNIYVAAGVNV